MRAIILTLCAACASCLATSGEIDRAIAEITGDIAAVARSGEESAEAARQAWVRGEITAAELDKRLQDIRAATLNAGKETARDVLEGVKETIEKRPEEVVSGVGGAVGGALPGTPGEIILWGSSLLATYLAARRAAAEKAAQAAATAKRDAEDLVWDAKHERLQEHLAKAEGKK